MSLRRSPGPEGQRSDDEREYDRQERIRRRAALDTAPGPPVPLPPPEAEGRSPGSGQQPSSPMGPHPSERRPGGPDRGGGRRWGSALVVALCLLALIALAGALALAIDHVASKKTPKPIAAPVVVKVLIPEGDTRTQIAVRAHAAGLTGSYLAASKRSALLNPVRYGAPAATPSLEGFLFPATYDLYRGDPASRLVHEQLDCL